MRMVDIDKLDASALESLWHELERARQFKNHDPELRDDIEKAITAALNDGRITELRALEIEVMLEEAVPSVVLEQTWRELIPNLDRKALGAFPRREIGPAPDLDQWLRDDPSRLAGLVAEMGRFTNDLKRIASAVLDLADKLGIPEDVSDPIVSDALHALNREQRQVAINAK